MSTEDLGLTEAELEAIAPEETEDEDAGAEVDADSEGEQEAAEEEGAAESPEGTELDDPVEDTGPRATEFTAESTEGMAGSLDALTTTLAESSDALAAKYEAGELSFSEYRKQDRVLQNEYDAEKQSISEALLTERIAAEHSQQSAEQTWRAEQDLFYADNEVYKTDLIMRGALGAQLDALYGDEANTGKSGLWFLREAGKAIDAKFHRAPADESASKLAGAKDAQKKEAAKPLGAPTTLGDVPSAETNDDAGEFAALDKLSGLDYENAIAGLTPAAYERFMAS